MRFDNIFPPLMQFFVFFLHILYCVFPGTLNFIDHTLLYSYANSLLIYELLIEVCVFAKIKRQRSREFCEYRMDTVTQLRRFWKNRRKNLQNELGKDSISDVWNKFS